MVFSFSAEEDDMVAKEERDGLKEKRLNLILMEEEEDG